MDEAFKLLKRQVIDEGKCVTKTNFLRQTSLKERQVESLLDDFYEKNKSLSLSATFMILGKKESESGGSPVRQSILCNQDTLEQTKNDFDTVISTHVYSLHSNLNTSVQTLLNADWSGRYERPQKSIEQRLGIICTQAVESHDKVQKHKSKATSSGFVIPPFNVRVKNGPKPLSSSIVCKSDQHKLKDVFAKAAKRNEAAEQMEVDLDDTPRKRPSPNKSTSEEPSNKSAKIESNKTKKPVPAKKPIFQKPKAAKKKSTSNLKQAKLNFKPV